MRIAADDGTILHTEQSSDPAANITVVFVTGLNTTVIYWSRQRETLADLGRLVVFDHRGHGRSAESPLAGATLGQLGRDVAAVIDAVAPTGAVVVVAHSVGATAVLALAQQRPELFGTRIVGVALLDAVASDWGRIGLRLPRFLTHVVVRLLWFTVPPLRRAFTDTTERRHRLRHAGGRTGPSGRRPWSGPLRRVRTLITSLRTMTLLSLLADAALCDYSGGLESLGTTAVLVIAGDGDRFIPLRHKTAMAARIPGARVLVVSDAGHLSSITRPDIIDPALRDFILRITEGEHPQRIDRDQPINRIVGVADND